MELSNILIIAAVLACPIAMGLMMWMMNRNMGGQQDHSMPGHTMHTSEADRLKALREQQQGLNQEIAEMQKIVELEAQKKALTRAATTESPSESQT